MSRPIVLPELPDHPDSCIAEIWSSDETNAIRAYARAAVEADRKGIVVTDEDLLGTPAGTVRSKIRAALESFAQRLRGTPTRNDDERRIARAIESFVSKPRETP